MASTPQTKSNLTAWERWELASFEEATNQSPTAAATSAKTAREAAVPPAPTFSAEEIAQLREQARRDGHAEGHREGYEAGLGEGRAKGEAEALALGRAAAESLVAATARFEEQVAALDGALAEEVVALATEIAREVIRQSIAIKPETVVSVVREAIAQLPLQHASIHLHPEDSSLVRSYAGEQLSHAGHRVHDDPKLARGDVLVECGGSQLDATVATRWRRVLDRIGHSEPWLQGPAGTDPAP
jgi:flagellar assembly protein FliH